LDYKRSDGRFIKGDVPWNKGKTGLQVAWNKGTKGIIKANSGSFKKGQTSLRKGIKHSSVTKRKISESRTGKSLRENHPNWKGGIRKALGYTMILNSEHPFASKSGYVMEHRLIMEEYLGRYLNPDETIHHIDFNKSNNDINNLYLFESDSKHRDYHWFLINLVKKIMGDNYARTRS